MALTGAESLESLPAARGGGGFILGGCDLHGWRG